MQEDRRSIGSLIEDLAKYVADLGISEDDNVSITEMAHYILGVVQLVCDSQRGEQTARIQGATPLQVRVASSNPQATPSTTLTDLPKGWLSPEEDALVPPRHLWIGPRDPISHYYRWIWEYLAYLTLLCDLRRESVVLELGCGHGRTARGLIDYLRDPGFYRGLHVDCVRIQDAQERLQRRFPHMQFVWADVYNAHYNPAGRAPAASYVFPFADATFDVIYAASLFTHLLPDECANYFRESHRVLKPSGKCLFSLFALDHYRGWGTTISPLYEFVHPLPGYAGVAVRDLEHPDALIGYSVEAVTSLAAQAGLRLLRVLPGLWSQSPGLAVNEQDLLVFDRAD
jgi:SAM-dependent methyltransferase